MSGTVCYKFRLYIAGDTPNSVQAKLNLSALCRSQLPGQYKIEIIDVLQRPTRALADGIFMTPCLLRLAPSPVRMIVGTLIRSKELLETLGMAPEPA